MRLFQHTLTCLTTRKRCFLQWKLSIFMFYQKIETQKNEQKNTSKMMKKWVRKPQKWGSCRGEMVGFEKSVFFKKKQTSQKSSKNMLTGPLPPPCFLQWFRRIFTLKKSAFFGPILAPFGSLMFPKPYFLQWISMILEQSFLVPKNALLTAPCSPDGFKSPSLGPSQIVHPDRHLFTHTLKRFVHVKPPRN